MVKVARITRHGIVRTSGILSLTQVNLVVENIRDGVTSFNGHFVRMDEDGPDRGVWYDLQTVQARRLASKRRYAGKSITQSIGPMIRMAGVKF
jgi:hypothetical protein